MSDIKITVDYSQVGGAISSLGQLQAAGRSLGTALAQNKITQSQYMTAVNQLSAAAKRLGISLNQAKSSIMTKANEAQRAVVFTNALAAAEDRLGISTGRSTRSMGRASVMTQQLGYQMGDFLVQVQSGTNWIIAFGQQATQIAGTLTQFGGKMVLIGSALGVAIPLMTALAGAFMRTRRAANDAGSSASSFTSRLDSARERIASTANELSRLMQGFHDLEELTLNEQIAQVSGEIGNLTSQIVLMENQLSAMQPSDLDFLADAGTGVLEDALRLQEDALSTAQAELEALLEQRRVQAQLNALEEQRERSNAANEARVEAILERLGEQRRVLSEIREEAERGRLERDEMSNTLAQEQVIYEAILAFGAESAEVEALRAQHAREAFEARVRETTQYEEVINRIMEQYDTTESARLATEALEDALAGITGLDTSNTVAAINSIVSALGIATDQAITLARNLPGYTGGGVSGPDGAVEQSRTDFADGARNFRERMVFPPTGSGRSGSSGSGGGGGGGRSSLEDIINQRMEQIRQERELIGLSEEARRLREISLEIERAYGEELSETQRVAVDTAAQQILAIESVIEAQERQRQMQEDFADTVADSFGDAFMSIIDGTKSAEEAFRDMVANILQELVRLTIINPIMESVRGAVMGGSGGFFGSIGLFGGKATGGYMNPGGAYLVGERGPELVVPGRGSTVTNAQQTADLMNGGGSKSPVFNMTYNFQGGITEQDLGRALPRIVEETKRSVMDSVQRGGATARVFR